MKQIEQNYRSGALRVIDAPAPRPGRGSALVASRASLISAGTEKQTIELARASLAGKALQRPDLVRQLVRKARREGFASVTRKVFAKLDTPIPLGYSLAGVVIEAGEAAGVRRGDRVACAGAGIANHAEYNVVPRNLCVRIPDGVSDDDASFVTLGAIALQGLRVAAPTLGERVAVIGLGLIGLLTVQLLRANGCKVLGYDPDPARVQLARELGADIAVSDGLETAASAFSDGVGVDAVILTASTKSSDPLNQAAEISRLKGRVVVVGLVGMNIDRDPFYKRELDLRLSMSYGPGRHDPSYEVEGHDYPLPYVRWTERRNMEAFLDLVASGAVTPSKLVTHSFPIESAEKAYKLMDGDEPYLAILLTYQASDPAPATTIPTKPAPHPSGGVGFIGMGNYAKSVLLPAVQQSSGSPFDMVVTATGISAHAAAEKFGFARASTRADDLFEDNSISSVFIATRHDTHADLTIRALKAGKNVFVEKPLALTYTDLETIEATALQSPGVLTVGFNRRFAPMTLQALALVAERHEPLAMTYRINAGRLPRESWIHGAEGGGRIIGEVCHFVDFLSAIAGSPPIAVDGASPGDVTDSLAATLRFADGSVATLLYSSRGDEGIGKEQIEIIGDGVIIQIDDFSAITVSRKGRVSRRKARQDKGQSALVAAFLKAAQGDGPVPIALADLLAVSRATLALAGISHPDPAEI